MISFAIDVYHFYPFCTYPTYFLGRLNVQLAESVHGVFVAKSLAELLKNTKCQFMMSVLANIDGDH